MKDVTEHLVADLDWRLSPAGKAYKPDDKELNKYGVERHGCLPTILLWAVMMLGYVGLVAGLVTISEDIFLPLGVLMGFVMSFIFGRLAGQLNRSWQKRRDKAAYSKLLKSNERFMLVEYSRYLSRKIHQAQRDPSLGAAQEAARLKELQGRIADMLRRGGGGRPGQPSMLEEEATIAESLLEAYGHEDFDPLSKLDERLPATAREKLKQDEERLLAGSRQELPPIEARQPSPAQQAASSQASASSGGGESELPRWARELGQIIESMDLGEVLGEAARDSSAAKGKQKQK